MRYFVRVWSDDRSEQWVGGYDTKELADAVTLKINRMEGLFATTEEAIPYPLWLERLTQQQQVKP